MMLHMFTVLDKATQSFFPPFYVRHPGEALRAFQEKCNDTNSEFFKYAADYVLMSCGSYDDQTGIAVGVEPVRIIGALEVISETPLDPPPRETVRRPM